MRLSMATAISVALAATLFAGCSTSPQGSSALPGSSSVSQPMSHGGGGAHKHIHLTGKIGPETLLKYQVAGKVAGPGHTESSEVAAWPNPGQDSSAVPFPYRRRRPRRPGRRHRIRLSPRDDQEVQDHHGRRHRDPTAATTRSTVKVDSAHNIWAACEYGSSSNAGAAQEYSSTGSLMHSLQRRLPEQHRPRANASSCTASRLTRPRTRATSSRPSVLRILLLRLRLATAAAALKSLMARRHSRSSSRRRGLIPSSGYTIDGTGYFDADSNNNVYYEGRRLRRIWVRLRTRRD